MISFHCPTFSDQKIWFLVMLQSISGIACSNYNFLLFSSAVTEHYNIETNKMPVLRRPIVNSQCFYLLEDDKIMATISNFPLSRESPMSQEQAVVLTPSQPNVYDPYFLLEWISNLFSVTSDSQGLEVGIDLKTVFSKQIVSFLIACQTSECHHIRLLSRLYLNRLFSIFQASERKGSEFWMEQVIFVLASPESLFSPRIRSRW